MDYGLARELQKVIMLADTRSQASITLLRVQSGRFRQRSRQVAIRKIWFLLA